MSLPKIIWTALIGCVILISSLLGAWGMNLSSTVREQGHNLEKVVSAVASHETALQDIHSDLLRIERLLEEQNEETRAKPR